MRWILPILLCALAPSISLASVDSDGDGVIDNRETSDGTDPNDSTSFFPLSQGLVAHYQLDGNGSDASGFARHATNFGASPAENRSGVSGEALFFNGSAYLQTPIGSNLRTLTISAWFATDSLRGPQSIVDSDIYGRNGHSLFIGYFLNNTLDIQYHDGVYTSPWELTDNLWHHAVAVFEFGKVTLFVDGKFVGSKAYAASTPDGSSFRIGRHNSVHASWFLGRIDDVRLYNRALTANEVALLYTFDKYNGLGLEVAATKSPFDPATATSWSAGGTEWTVDTAISRDGVDSVKAQTSDGQSTYREYTVTGPAVVDFWWKVSSEQLYDTFSYALNGVNQQTISGEFDWTYRTLTIPEGTHKIRWTYTKDESGAVGQDAGWLDDFAVYSATATLQVRDGSTTLTDNAQVNFGSGGGQNALTKTLSFQNSGYVPLEVELSLPSDSPFTFADGSREYLLLLGRADSSNVSLLLPVSSAGQKSATLTISAPDSTSPPPSIQLTGTVVGGDIRVAQGGNQIASGQPLPVDLGIAPREVEFTITNNGNVADLVISQLSASGNFQITQQPATTVAVGGSTTFKVLASDSQQGVQFGSISISSNDEDTPVFTIPVTSKALLGLGTGATTNSTATGGEGGGVGWDFATATLPSGSTGSASRTGSTPDGGQSYLEATFAEAGLLSWTWKVSTQENFDWLLCEVDGQEVAGISTKNGVWQTQVVQVPAGANVRWVYRKDVSGSIGEDAGYVTDVEFRSFAASQSFSQWGQAHSISEPQQRLPKSAVQAIFAWLGGIDPAVGPDAGHHVPIIEGGRLKYRFPISKTADGIQQILYSSDMSAWTTRRFRQRIVSEDAGRMVIEATAPSGTKGFFKVVGGGDTLPLDMLRVAGGSLPQVSELSGTLVQAFSIGKYEVTLKQWQEVRDWAVSNGYNFFNYGTGKGPNHPVDGVSWCDAVLWCNARSEKEGLTPVYEVGGVVYRTGVALATVNSSANGYRLPTEAEWEWAARGGVSSQGYIYSGSNDVNAVAWYGGNRSDGTKAVGTKTANELGIYDMSGNVWEWCDDGVDISLRPLLGGAFTDTADSCAVGHRGTGAQFYVATNSFGFRVARNAD